MQNAVFVHAAAGGLADLGQSTIRSDDDGIPSSINTTGVVVHVNPYGAHTRTICGK